MNIQPPINALATALPFACVSAVCRSAFAVVIDAMSQWIRRVTVVMDKTSYNVCPLVLLVKLWPWVSLPKTSMSILSSVAPT